GHHRRFGRRVTVKEWGEEVDYLPRGGERYYSPQDYYLGDLRGIMEKIPYLKSLGVGAVYLNPIFESAYNHRYSISDHMKLDPLLVDEEDLRALINALHGADIKLILDGVFSHTGDDSVYFDRYGNYGGGAWSDPRSPYREWYDFDPKYKHGFRCWWDFETLPEVEELTPSYMDHIAAVLEKWTRLGADGWRLDVADELPDEFIRFLRRKLKALSPEALLIGEVWEDAALKKDGFGKRREYVNGAELDGVMDYPFSDAALDFLLGKIDAGRLASLLISQLEGYPKCFMRTQLGLLGSHDMPRVLSILSGAPEKDSVPREAQAAWRATEEGEKLGKKRLMQASALQFSMPFMPCVYYGDEAGLHGLSDPFCRRPFPWGHEDAELTAHYRRLAELREQCPELKEGAAAFAHCGRDVFAIARLGEREVFTVVNRADTEADILLSAADFRGEARPKEGELRFEGVPAHGFKVFIR
ncbi:MAG: glycoside hydrolase family 13 protein, partial [Clostridia bacterium]|nr:glycoside hydrolase family 13 protein [Clostridia bacterium]